MSLATMGNVLAASSPPVGPPPPPPPPSPPGFTLHPLGGDLGAGASARVEVQNGPPGRLQGPRTMGPAAAFPTPAQECDRKCKELVPIQMEGVKLTVNKGLRSHFQHNGESNYHFGVTYVGTKQLSPTEAFPVLVGDMDNSGGLNAQVIHQLGPGLRSKMAIQTQQSKLVNWPVDGEYRGSDFTAAVTLGNPDVLVGSGILVAHFLQSIPCVWHWAESWSTPAAWGGGYCHVSSWETHDEQLVGDSNVGPGGHARDILPQSQ
ncbi:LOW QUALITY PROTEIN: hypothetical protein QTO34_006878 [Cnephaeus nilssonii]|uniref:Mitochondrial import receptor subunit TOM40 homolog n=1 Tax=Cnephaeus nilssonii TaxID=3371016 RepID=A0AA40LG17_CNENI|nr:LOW QUALITY PROTEIN: hypothetical protein QTO34_006878 [Eptesicus nilssonii]